MPETREQIEDRLQSAIAPGYRERLLDKGLARGLIWLEGNLPQGAPRFPDTLTADLLDYAFAVLSASLSLKNSGPPTADMTRGFIVAGEAIESAVHRGNEQVPDQGFNRLTASIAFHLAGYSARAFSILPNVPTLQNFTPAETVLYQLLRRRLDVMRGQIESWLKDEGHSDTAIAGRLAERDGFVLEDAVDITLKNSFMRGLALFSHALLTGDGQYAAQARERLLLTATSATELGAVGHWWTSTLAYHLIGDLWDFSLHRQIPGLPPDDPDAADWNLHRWQYIQRLRLAKNPALELWPSQLEAAKRILHQDDDLVVALPTSGGKTRIAELAILRALASGRRIIYVTPLRALSAQIERDLASIFVPLGKTVSALYGSTGIENGDSETLKTGRIVVATPEKLDFALRNDPSLIDDVGLIVLDEGHMLGPGEREVRYEALVQRLLRRPDADNRRLVCLSALFPSPAEMSDLVSWIRRDQEGGPVYSSWRPTRQRFGTLIWSKGAARLEAKVEEEQSFVNRFIVGVKPPKGRRTNKFPADRNELTLAAAWRFIEQKKDVMVYCALRGSVEVLGKALLKCIAQGVLKSLTEMNGFIEHAMRVGSEWLGEKHPAVLCLQYGVALHHAGLPRAYLAEVEALLRGGHCRLTIASPTLAQGLNLSASVLIVPSIWRNQKIIPVSEFANVSGRAGRAFVDLEGLVLHTLWKPKPWQAKEWDNLVARSKAPVVKSGILTLAAIVLDRLAFATGNTLEDTLAYVTGQNANWSYVVTMATVPEEITTDNIHLITFLAESRPELVAHNRWEDYLASLDAALFALLESNLPPENLEADIDAVLQGSLFTRQIQTLEDSLQIYLKAVVTSRASYIWLQSTQAQRKGFHFAGIGLTSGLFLHQHLDELETLLLSAEVGVMENDPNDLAEAVLGIARLVFQMSPFKPNEDLPEHWEVALKAWLFGEAASTVIEIGGKKGVDMLQDAFTYRLPWAMEAIRVVSKAEGTERSDLFDGKAAMAVEVGSSHQAIITLLRSGLASREAALKVVCDTGAEFDNYFGMTLWLKSELVRELSALSDWPTERTRTTWVNFVQGEQEEYRRPWIRSEITLGIDWLPDFNPQPGFSVVLAPFTDSEGGNVYSPEMKLIGTFTVAMPLAIRYISAANISASLADVSLQYFGPSYA